MLRRHPELTDGDAAGDFDPVDGIVIAALLLVALVVTLTFPRTSYYPLLLLIAADGLAERWKRLRGRGPHGARVGE